MHALNSTLVSCLDRPPVERWSTSDIPQQLLKGYRQLKKGGQRAIHTPLWFESAVQLANRNQASVTWPNMFDYLDPGGKNVTLGAQKFHDWSVEGRALWTTSVGDCRNVEVRAGLSLQAQR